MNGISTRRVKIESGGTGVVAHVGLHAVGSFADAVGLGDALSDAVLYRGRGIPVHDRGTVLVHTALMLAGGGESCLDIEHLRAGPLLFGGVASDTAVARPSQRSASRIVNVSPQRSLRYGNECGPPSILMNAIRCCWTSTRRSSGSTPRTRRTLPRRSRAPTGSTR
ncbi:MAG: transposase [Actinobacteria bacterium]|nr:transposase [Actinomycetota bacterium]